jgi:hypothetical protein
LIHGDPPPITLVYRRNDFSPIFAALAQVGACFDKFGAGS